MCIFLDCGWVFYPLVASPRAPSNDSSRCVLEDPPSWPVSWFQAKEVRARCEYHVLRVLSHRSLQVRHLQKFPSCSNDTVLILSLVYPFFQNCFGSFISPSKFSRHDMILLLWWAFSSSPPTPDLLVIFTPFLYEWYVSCQLLFALREWHTVFHLRARLEVGLANLSPDYTPHINSFFDDLLNCLNSLNKGIGCMYSVFRQYNTHYPTALPNARLFAGVNLVYPSTL